MYAWNGSKNKNEKMQRNGRPIYLPGMHDIRHDIDHEAGLRKAAVANTGGTPTKEGSPRELDYRQNPPSSRDAREPMYAIPTRKHQPQQPQVAPSGIARADSRTRQPPQQQHRQSERQPQQPTYAMSPARSGNDPRYAGRTGENPQQSRGKIDPERQHPLSSSSGHGYSPTYARGHEQEYQPPRHVPTSPREFREYSPRSGRNPPMQRKGSSESRDSYDSNPPRWLPAGAQPLPVLPGGLVDNGSGLRHVPKEERHNDDSLKTIVRRRGYQTDTDQLAPPSEPPPDYDPRNGWDGASHAQRANGSSPGVRELTKTNDVHRKTYMFGMEDGEPGQVTPRDHDQQRHWRDLPSPSRELHPPRRGEYPAHWRRNDEPEQQRYKKELGRGVAEDYRQGGTGSYTTDAPPRRERILDDKYMYYS